MTETQKGVGLGSGRENCSFSMEMLNYCESSYAVEQSLSIHIIRVMYTGVNIEMAGNFSILDGGALTHVPLATRLVANNIEQFLWPFVNQRQIRFCNEKHRQVLCAACRLHDATRSRKRQSVIISVSGPEIDDVITIKLIIDCC